AFPGSIYHGQRDSFIAKYDSAGQLLFAQNYGTAGDDLFLDIGGAASQQGLSVVGTSSDKFGNEPKGGLDLIVGSYNSEGQVRRLNQFGGLLDNVGTTLSMSDREIIVGGYTRDSFNEAVLAGGEDAFLAYMKNASAIDF